MSDLETLRFPIGRFTPPVSFTPESRKVNVDTFRRLPEKLRIAVKDLTETQLDTPYRENGWTIRQVVHHLADSHANAYVRFRLALTEDWPTIVVYNEAEWANLPDSCKQSLDNSLEMIEGLHGRLVSLFESISDTDYEKGYVHPKSGRQTLALAVALYDWHSRHHTAHITSLCQRQGW